MHPFRFSRIPPLWLCLAFFFFIWSAPKAQNVSVVEVKDFGSNPGNLEMYFHIPTSDTNRSMPLLVALHGCAQTAQGMADLSGWNEISDKYGFAVLYPQQKGLNNPSRCFNWFYSKGDQPSGEEVSVREMIRYMVRHAPIDTTQIFCYGLSAGAVMAVNLMARYPCLFLAGASIAGGAYHMADNSLGGLLAMLNPPDKRPEEWGALMPQTEPGCLPFLIVLHGTADPVANPGNSDALIAQWTHWWGTDNKVDIHDSAYCGNGRVERNVYLSRDDGTCVISYRILHPGHALPVDPGEGEMQGGRTGAFAKDVDFFSTWHIARDLGLVGAR